MLQKKMFVLACAIAIVGIGACFLPPAHMPPPPLPPYLVHVQRISIQVQDASGQDLIDESAMSRAVASNFNSLWSEYAVHAEPIRDSTHSDATLRITIDSKSASASTGKQWNVDLKSTSVLIANDGRVLWQRHDENAQYVLWLGNGFPSGGWNSTTVRHQLAYSLAMAMGDILNGRAQRNASEKHP